MGTKKTLKKLKAKLRPAKAARQKAHEKGGYKSDKRIRV